MYFNNYLAGVGNKKLKKRSEIAKVKLNAKIAKLGVIITESGAKLAQLSIVDAQYQFILRGYYMSAKVNVL